MQYGDFNALLNCNMTHYWDLKNFVAQASVLKLSSRLSFYYRYQVAKMT